MRISKTTIAYAFLCLLGGGPSTAYPGGVDGGLAAHADKLRSVILEERKAAAEAIVEYGSAHAGTEGEALELLEALDSSSDPEVRHQAEVIRSELDNIANPRKKLGNPKSPATEQVTNTKDIP